MATLHTEEEQVEALKRWWKQNGWSTVLGIVMALALYLGWQNWQTRQHNYAAEASVRYQQLLMMVQANERSPTEAQLARASQSVENLKADFGDTSYARFAALLLARLQVVDGDLQGAQEQLRWVLDQRNDAAIDQLAQLRLARVLFALGEDDEAMAIADLIEDKNSDSAFAAGFYELQGDISSDRGDLDAARDFYRQALEQGGGAGGYSNPMVRLKLESLAVSESAPAEQEG